MDMYLWIQNKEFDKINDIIYKLDDVINLELFDIIVTQMEFLLLECKDEYLKSNYIKILCNAIWVAGRNPKHYGKYVEQLFYSTYDSIRLCCYANLDLTDTIRELSKNENDEIKGIVSMRDEFEHIWENEIDEYAKERIMWFRKLIDTGIICVNSPYSREYKCIGFTYYEACCFYFQNNVVKYMRSDNLKFYDKRIMPYFFNQMFENGELIFKEGVRLPECFMTEEGKKHIRVRRK